MVRKRVRRGQSRKNMMKTFKVMYNNVRGVKSKEGVIKRIIYEENPTILALAETKLNELDVFDLEEEGYSIERNDRNGDGGGVLIAYRKSLDNVITTLSKYNNFDCEMLWMKIDNGIEKIRIGVIYMPQESRTLLKDIKTIYNAIADEAKKAVDSEEKIMIVGDFNCKVGIEIEGNREEVSKGGRELLKLVNKYNLKLLNSDKSCNGLWTRKQGNELSVLDYVIVRREDTRLVTVMEIDEDRNKTPYSLECATNDRVFTDHFMMTCIFNWRIDVRMKKQVKKLEKKNIEAYKHHLEEEKVSELIDNRPIRESYSEWCKKTLQIRDKYSSRKKIQRKWKVHRILAKERRKIKKLLKTERNKDMIQELKRRRSIIMDLIDKEMIQKQCARTNKILSDVKKAGGVNSKTFWDVRNRFIGRCAETADVMEDDSGNLQEDSDQIKEIHAKHFEKLLSRCESETVEGKNAEETIKLVEQGMEILAGKEKPQQTTKDDVEMIVKNLDVKKARDSGSWSNLDIKEGGEEMISSLHKIFRKMESEMDIASEWESMDIKPIHKKGLRSQMNNKRGIFLTNNIGKVFEKIIKERNSYQFNEKITEWANGGVKGRAGLDNVMIAAAIIERNQYLGRNTYLTFTDAEKCFDKLWLEDGINELWRVGTNIRDSVMIKRMNEMARIVVQTPLGPTRVLEVKRIVKQGTVYGPQICISSMDKVNLLGRNVTTFYGPDLEICAVTYVDDVTGVGGVTNANNVIYNCSILEDQKKMTFSNKDGKTEYLVVPSKDDPVRTVTAQVRRGAIKRVPEHNMLGTWFDETGKFGVNIVKRRQKFQFMIGTAKGVASTKNMGILAIEGRLKIAEIVIMPSLLYNAEAFAEYTKQEIEELEKLQASMLRQLLEVPKSTSYVGILMETGWLTVEAQLDYRKLMLYHNILNSDDKRTLKKILAIQKAEDRSGTWYSSVCRLISKYSIDLDPAITIKSAWKREVKNKIREITEKEIRTKCSDSIKTRTVRRCKYELKEYLKIHPINVAQKIMLYRLHMINIPMNYKNSWMESTCPLCSGAEGDTEHFLACERTKSLREIWSVSTLEVESPQKMEMTARFFLDVQTLVEPKWRRLRKE